MTPDGLKAEMERVQAEHGSMLTKKACWKCSSEAWDDPWPCDAYRAASMVLGVLEIHKGLHDCANASFNDERPCPTIQAMCAALGEGGEE